MKFPAILGAVLGALLGAGAWGAISYYTGFEVGYVAIGVGFLVGLGAKLGGASGTQAGVICAVLAVLAILGGKMLAVDLAMPYYAAQAVEENISQAQYDEIMTDARSLDEFDGNYAAYMVEREYTEAEHAADVSSEEVAWFTSEVLPELKEMAREEPSFEEYKEAQSAEFVAMLKENFSTFDMVKEDLGMFDLLWAVLGIVTAFQVAAAGEEEEGLPA